MSPGAMSENSIEGGIELDQQEYEVLRRLIKRQVGVDLGARKRTLVRARLAKRLRTLGLESYGQYIERLASPQGAQELTELVNAIVTNVTSFFRQEAHFEYLRNEVLPRLVSRGDRRLRIWSAACSTGEEPYSIGIHLREGIQGLDRWDAKVLATDISTRALAKARSATYERGEFGGFPKAYARRHLAKVETRDGGWRLQVREHVRELVTFGRLNLMGAWDVRGPFDAIFCRNVMIYFDKPTQRKLVQRFLDLLEPGGVLFIGHSEVIAGDQDGFRSAGPAIYTRTRP